MVKVSRNDPAEKARLAAIEQVANVIAHEMRNPLAVINNSAYFIKAALSGTPGTDSKIHKHIGIIESEIHRANGIINDILAYARKSEPELTTQSLNNFIERLLAEYPFPPHTRVTKNFTPDNPSVLIDAEKIKQAICGIIRNAIEAASNGCSAYGGPIAPPALQGSRSGQGTASAPARQTSGGDSADGCVVKFTTQVEQNEWVKLEISDTGPGIPKDIIEKIFDPFFTTKQQKLGLGLSTARKIIEGHNGQLQVESPEGKGATAKIRLPRQYDK